TSVVTAVGRRPPTAPRRPWLVVDWSAVPCCAMDWAVADRDGAVPKREFVSPPRALPMPLIMLPKKYPDDCLVVSLLDLLRVVAV
uniref:hypothetical protein n=1 Tax=Tropheryma whipplei TaxID=2039 RepID=UPI001E33B8F8